MKYKGKSISFQREKGKKPPKIEVVDSKNISNEDEDNEKSIQGKNSYFLKVKKQK